MTNTTHTTLTATRVLFKEHQACVLLPIDNIASTVNKAMDEFQLCKDQLMVANDDSTNILKTILYL